MPSSAVANAIFVLRTDGRRRPIRHHQAVPELSEITNDPAVSSSTDPPFSHVH